jgi:hypothetical protein
MARSDGLGVVHSKSNALNSRLFQIGNSLQRSNTGEYPQPPLSKFQGKSMADATRAAPIITCQRGDKAQE